MPTVQDQQKRPEPPKPVWVREPRAVPKNESRPAPQDEPHAPDEPGYGHGV